MRVTKEVSMHLIDWDRLPMNPTTLALVDHLRSGGIVPPIHLVKTNNAGRFKLIDGRHRWLASKLLGRTKIKARFWEKAETVRSFGYPTATITE